MQAKWHGYARCAAMAALLAVTMLVVGAAVAGGEARAEAVAATILEPGRCALPPNRTYGEGMGPGVGLPATGSISAVMLFVEFPDQRGSGMDTLFAGSVPAAQTWYRNTSGGRLSLEVTQVPHWIRLEKNSADYRIKTGTAQTTGQISTAVIADAIRAADAEVDFSKYQLVYVVLPPGLANVSFESPASIAVDGVRVSRSILLTSLSARVVIHETAHALGLPDLYDTQGSDLARSGRFAGLWDIMTSGRTVASLTLNAWHRWKLGWLEADQIRCLGAGSIEETIVPLTASRSGTKAVVVPVNATQNYVVEVRDRVGDDVSVCTPGVLVYLVDQAVTSGTAPGPVQVRPASAAAEPAREQQCGLLYDAPFRHDRVARYEDPAAGFAMEVLGAAPEGFRVRVTGPSTAVAARAGRGAFLANPVFGASGNAAAVFSDGTVDQLETAARLAAAGGVWMQDGRGNFQLLVVGGPAFLKDQVKAAFPNGFAGPTAVTLTRRAAAR